MSLDVCGLLLSHLPVLVSGSLRMAMEGTSAAQGRSPGWMTRACDLRFTGYGSDGDDTVMAVELPRIGDAAEELFRQEQFWDTRPDPEQTALDVFQRVVDEVAAQNAESASYDRNLLARMARLGRLFGRELRAVGFGRDEGGTKLDEVVANHAARLGTETPASRQVRVAGFLDMIRHSTRTFGVRLESGEEVHGVMESTEAANALRDYFGKAVLVSGRAVYRPSGRLLRIDATALLFQKVPPPLGVRRSPPVRLRGSESGRVGVPAFFGTWPGDETDADFDALVRDVRGGAVATH